MLMKLLLSSLYNSLHILMSRCSSSTFLVFEEAAETGAEAGEICCFIENKYWRTQRELKRVDAMRFERLNET